MLIPIVNQWVLSMNLVQIVVISQYAKICSYL